MNNIKLLQRGPKNIYGIFSFYYKDYGEISKPRADAYWSNFYLELVR